MVIQTQHISSEEIVHAVEQGLSARLKYLPSWLLYDGVGDKLFQQIMKLPSYYPTRSEAEIIEYYKEDFLAHFSDGGKHFNLIELGAGDGTKTEMIIDTLMKHHARFTYLPVDISENALLELSKRLLHLHPSLDLQPQHLSYDEALGLLDQKTRNVLLFLGANIGNMTIEEAGEFLQRLSGKLMARDMVMIGFDLKKEPRIIEAAYDDPEGVTREFNLNVLRRLNKEMQANFKLDQFEHYPFYNPESGTASSYLISLKDQDVRIEAISRTIHFSQWESIHMEISQKYDLLMIENLLTKSGLEIADLFFDRNHYFCNVIATPGR